jgi:hypothetical protein
MYAHIYGWFYRRWSLLIHRYGYHHMQVSYPADEFGVHPMVCSFCGQDAMLCNIWNEPNRCVERAALDIVRSAGTSVP